jgi:3-deoxy-D-manno-octulosonic-acid transferase
MAVPAALILIVPRHAERRAQVKADLERNGFEVVLRSSFPHAHGRDENHDENLQEPHAPPARVPSSDLTDTPPACLVIDTTGELRDWTAHADVVIIGKSFLATGGQNPCEAILAGKPVIFGPHMENFEPLASRLLAAHAAFLAPDPAGLSAAIVRALDPAVADGTTTRAAALLQRHHGATRRIVELLIRP